MFRNKNRWIALSVLFAMLLTTLGGFVTPAHAGAKGRRNTTIGLGVLTGIALLKHKKTLAIAGALGTAYAYHRYRKAKKSERRHSRLWYQRRYGRNWKYHYYHG